MFAFLNLLEFIWSKNVLRLKWFEFLADVYLCLLSIKQLVLQTYYELVPILKLLCKLPNDHCLSLNLLTQTNQAFSRLILFKLGSIQILLCRVKLNLQLVEHLLLFMHSNVIFLAHKISYLLLELIVSSDDFFKSLVGIYKL